MLHMRRDGDWCYKNIVILIESVNFCLVKERRLKKFHPNFMRRVQKKLEKNM